MVRMDTGGAVRECHQGHSRRTDLSHGEGRRSVGVYARVAQANHQFLSRCESERSHRRSRERFFRSDILAEQIFPTEKGADPSEFTRGWLKRIINSCRDAKVNGPTAGAENGFSVAYAQVYCVDSKGTDVDIFFKAIAGMDALYVVQREFRRPTEPGEVAGMRNFGKDQGDAAKAALEAQNAANDYLVSKVKLCANADNGICAPGTAKSEQAEKWPVEGKTTASEVRDKLGRPMMENRSEIGR